MDDEEKKIIKTAIKVIIGFFLLITVLTSFGTVPAGSVGVLTQFGKVINTYNPGLYLKLPWGIQQIVKMDTRVRKDDVKAEAGSKDLQIVNTDIVVNYHIKANKAGDIYQNIGTNEMIKVNIVVPAVSEVVKASVAKRNAEEVLTKRPELKQDIDDKLDSRLLPYNVILDDVSIVNVDFSPEFNKAIEDKQVAEQQAKQAEFVAKKAIKDAEAIVNRAKGEAEAQRLQTQTLTPELIQKMAIEKWNGQFPTYYGGSALPFLNLK